MTTSSTRKGIIFALCTALISGISVFVNKQVVSGVRPLVLTSTKGLFVALGIIGLLMMTHRYKQIKILSKRDIVRLLLIGLIGGALPFYLFFTGLTQVSALHATFIHKSLIVWVALLSILFLRERFTIVHAVSIVLLFSSNLLFGVTPFSFSTGEMMILGATLLWSVEHILAKKMLPTIDPFIVGASRMGIGSLILGMVLLFSGQAGDVAQLSFLQWQGIVTTSFFLLGYVVTWYTALRYASAITVSSILVGATVVTNILTSVFITHTLSSLHIVQTGMIVLGVMGMILVSHSQISQLLKKHVFSFLPFVSS